MENNKDIGKLFRDKIDQLDQSPKENGWLAIQSELDKKEKRRVLPFWFWYAGIFSLGIIFSTLVYKNFNNQVINFKGTDKVNVSKENNIEIGTNSNQEIITKNNEVETNEGLINKAINSKNNAGLVENDAEKTESVSISETKYGKKLNSDNEFEKSKSKTITDKYSETKNSEKIVRNKFIISKEATPIKNSKEIALPSSSKKNNTEWKSNQKIVTKTKIEFNKSLNENLKSDSKLVENDSEKTQVETILKSVKKLNSNNADEKSKILTDKYSVTKTKNRQNIVKNKLAKNKKYKRIKASKMITRFNSDNNNLESDLNRQNLSKKSSDDLINTTVLNQDKKLVLDSDTTQSKTKKAVQKIKSKNDIITITETDSVVKEDKTDKTVTVFVYGTPTTTGLFGSKSSLDNRLEKAASFSEISLGYGAYLCYQGPEKLSIRIGVAKNNLKFATKNANVNVSNYENIIYDNGISNQSIFVQSGGSQTMTIYQDLSYFEIPIEIKYKLLDKKIGVNAIFGIKQLFLDKNEVYVITANGFKSKIGQTSNLLKQTFGANLGLGLDYKISKKIKINLETMFQYNIKNTQNSQNSKPYSIGVLTGFEFILFGK